MDSRSGRRRGRLFVRTTDGMGPRIREDTGWGRGNNGMGPRIREDTGWGKGVFHGGRVAGEEESRQWADVRWKVKLDSRRRLQRGRLFVRTTDGDGSPHPRGQGMGKGSFSWREGSRGGGIKAMGGCQWKVRLDSRRGRHGGRLFVRTTEGDGSPHPREQRMGMGPRIREDKGWGKGVFHGGRVAGEEESRQWADVSGR